MGRFLKSRKQVIFFILFLLSILPFFGNFFLKKEVFTKKDELYTPSLSRLNTISKIVNYTDSVYAQKKLPVFDTAMYVRVVSRTVKERFFYGIAHYRFSENWIAYVSGKILWKHFSAIVVPDDILKHSEGLCSQQTIIFMEVLKQKRIGVRWVGLGYKEGPGHFLSEVHYNGSWRLYDVTIEPQWKRVVQHHKSMEYYLANKDSLFTVYENKMPRPLFDKITEKVAYGEANDFPAKKMWVFQKLTAWLCYFLPVFFFFMSIRAPVNQKKTSHTMDNKKKESIKEFAV